MVYNCLILVGLGISGPFFFCKSGIKWVVSMAKFGVEHESVKIFDFRWCLIPLKFEIQNDRQNAIFR